MRYGVKGRPDAPIELYDLSTDPGERRDLAAENHEQVARMVAIMRAAHVDSPDFPLF